MSGEFDRKQDNDEEASAQEELEASVARLSASDDDHDMALRLRRVEHLMRSAPLVRPSVDFAERVIEAIRRQEIDPFNRYSALGLIAGLGVAAAVVATMLSVFVLAVANVLFNWTQVYQLLVAGGGVFAEIFDELGAPVGDSPLLGVLTLLSVPLFFVWLWLMRVLKPSETGA